MFQSTSPNRSPLGGIFGIVVALVVFYLLFQLAGFVFSILWKAAPLVFLASLFIDHKVFTGFANSVFGLFKRNWVYGVIAGVLSVVLFPLVALYLLGMALFKRKVNKTMEEMEVRRKGELIDYEEIDTEIVELEDRPLPPPPEPLRRKDNPTSKYDDLFE